MRQLLKKQDSLAAFNASLELNPRERQLQARLDYLQHQMLRQYDSVSFFPHARYFYKSQGHMQTTELYQVLRQMPKGGVMHLHASAMGGFKWMVEKVASEENCYVYWEEEKEGLPRGKIRFYKPGKQPAGFYPGPELAKNDPLFKQKLYDLITLDITGDNDSTDVWAEFQKCFGRIDGFVSYAPLYKDFYRVALQEMLDDNVQLLELREGLAFPLYDLEHPAGYYTPDTTVRYWQELLAETRQQHPDFQLKLIYTNLRFLGKEAIMKDLEQAYALRKKYPDMIKGYDLVAEEDNGHTTLFFLDNWLKMDSLRKAYGTDMPLCLHDGESSWASSENLYDAVLLRSKRIGHGFNLFRFPVLQQLVKKMDISIEVNPLSNQILGYIRDLRIHPASNYIRQGIQISISPDDPAVFDYSGVTPDFWSIFLAWELDLRDLKQLALNSINYSNLNPREKQQALAAFEQKWQAWVNSSNKILASSGR